MTTKDTEKSIQEIWNLFKETSERFKETDRRFKETDKKFKERSKNLEKMVAETTKAVNALTGKWGRFVEGLIAPAVERLFKERGIAVDKVFQRVKAHRNGDKMEVDILAIDGEYAVLIEAKSTLKVDDVKEHIERLDKFKAFFPEYKKRKVIGAVGGIIIEEDSDKYAYRNGLFVIGESGDSAVILNDEDFKPRLASMVKI